MKKGIVVYYSWAGHTRQMAGIIAAQTGADVFEIVPEVPYTQNYSAVVKQAQKEIREGFRPAIRNPKRDLSDYDVVYVGTPIWWGAMAPPVATFLEGNDFSGKTMLPFTTHGSGGKGHSDRDIARMCPGAHVKEMYTAYEGGGRGAEKEVADWIAKNL